MPTVTGRAIQFSAAGGAFELVKKEFPEPGPGQVRIRVQACGVCHSDAITIAWGQWPGLKYPRIPGHEVAGVVDAVGPDVPLFKVGQRVGLGWHGGHCNYCPPCRRGDFILCQNGQVSGINFDGGYADYVIAPANAVAFIPDDLSDVDAAPLLCAGVTTYNSLRNSGARAGDLVAILGIGGLGHLGIQYAAKMGFKTVAIARGADKEALAKKLGAHVYLDNGTQDISKELQKMGGARIILATVTAADAMTQSIGGLGIDGQLLVVGAGEKPIEFNATQAISFRSGVRSWYSGTSMDSQETLAFSALSGVRPMTQAFPLEKYQEAYDAMMNS